MFGNWQYPPKENKITEKRVNILYIRLFLIFSQGTKKPDNPVPSLNGISVSLIIQITAP
jgi:hypothetical protein